LECKGASKVTSFALSQEDIAVAFGAGGITAKVATWTRPRGFQKGHKTGSQELSVSAATGKYSAGTSTVTMKFDCEVAGGFDDDSMFGW
jgi:hypothetical protein